MKHTTHTTTAKLVAALFATGMVASTAMAADASEYVKINDNGETSRGSTSATRFAVAVGIATKAEGLSSVAIGSSTNTNGESAVAVGAYAKAEKKATVALGQGATALEDSAVSIGQKAKSTGASSTAVGSGSQATVNAAAAFGADAQATANNATALGQGTRASGANTVAIGQKADASGNTATAVGSGAVATGRNAVATGAASTATGDFGIANGNKAAASEANAIASGNGAKASGVAAVATGATATASGAFSIASGLSSTASGTQAIALGRGAAATEEYSVALGSFSTTEAAVGTNEATVNGVIYSGFAGNAPQGTVSVGNATQKRTVTNVAAGRINATSTDAINGSQLYLVAGQAAAAKTEVVAGNNVAVKPDTGDNGQTVYTVSANSSTTAAGSDYVTVTPNAVTGANGETNTTYTVDLAPTTKQAIDRNAANVNHVNNRIDGISNRIDNMEKDLRAGIAGATAMAFLQRPNEAGKSIVSAAVGGFRDQQALAIGYARNSDNNKWSIKAGIGVNTQKDINWGGSVGYQW